MALERPAGIPVDPGSSLRAVSGRLNTSESKTYAFDLICGRKKHVIYPEYIQSEKVRAVCVD